MLQQSNPEDFVIATGRMETVRKFIELTAIRIGWDKFSPGIGIIWENEGVNEVGRRADTKDIVIRIDQRYFRPTEVDQLLGDPTKAKNHLGWTPKTTLEELISEMVENDLNEARKENLLKTRGFSIRNGSD